MKRKLLIGTAAVVATIILGITGYILILLAGNYVVDEQKLVMDSTTTMVDEKGHLISKLYIEDRVLTDIEQIPLHVQNAFVAIEDARFYEHHGIDMKAIFRALYKDILAGGKVEGGSTITQQLAKNVFLSNEKTLLRKTKEAIISINLERKYSKKKLLELYVNQIYFGHGAYGIETASQLYFNKSVSELTLEEGALLAGIPKSPTYYSPITNNKNSMDRRNLVLDVMQRRGFISAEDAVRAKGKVVSLNISEDKRNPAYATYIDMVMEEAKQLFNLTNEELMTGGYTITVPINAEVQQMAYELFKKEEYFPGTNESAEGAFVLLDANNGGVLSVIGGRNYVSKGINRVVVKRQPGSTLKPLAVYGPALEEKEYHPYSMLVDKPISYGDYTPKNHTGMYQGKMTMYEALIQSANAPAVWLLDKIGIDVGKKYIDKAGLSIPDQGLAIALGGLKEGISPIDLAKAYRAFAKDGKIVDPYFIKKMVNRDGEVIASVQVEEREVFSPQTAWYVTRMLEGVVDEGTARSGVYHGVLAGKTGTTSYTGVKGATRDAWFVGYTPNVVGALWMGYDTTNNEQYLKHGSAYPTRLFKKILSSSPVDQQARFITPKGVEELEEPIVMEGKPDIKSHITFKPLSLFTIQLTWEIQNERIEYKVYEKKDESWEYIGKVKSGEGSFEIENVNIFNIPSYYIIPYNPQTEEDGEKSNVVTPSFRK
ncbi:PBP1A family penicillin-binding protein [Bacillus sp. BGMRC 2118]|nr:PBP1A family penicillin-binding protein [Bacillus sp. BGMRC 2118]